MGVAAESGTDLAVFRLLFGRLGLSRGGELSHLFTLLAWSPLMMVAWAHWSLQLLWMPWLLWYPPLINELASSCFDNKNGGQMVVVETALSREPFPSCATLLAKPLHCSSTAASDVDKFKILEV